MHLGHSGAIIEIHPDHVFKTGDDLAAQAKYCADHPEAFVRVDSFWPTIPERYQMERLQPCTGRWTDIATDAIALARAHLWKPYTGREVAPWHFNSEWRRCLESWALGRGFPWITWELIERIYPTATGSRAEWIHGDMTIANVMRRGSRVVFIDPRPACDKVPPFREVDYGKLMQSALGWELLLVGSEPQRDEGLIDLVYKEAYKDGISQRAIEFWTAVNLARIIPYAKEQRIRDWAEMHSRRIADALSIRP